VKSIWVEDSPQPQFPTLDGSVKTDVLVIGGGIAGILCSYMLKQAGVDHILVEANRICGGITKNTTAKITLQHGLIYHKLIEKYGPERAKLYLDAQLEALQTYERLCSDTPCDYQKQDSYVYSRQKQGIMEQEVVALNRLGLGAMFSTDTDLPFEVAGAVRVKDQAQFHPLKFLTALAKGLPIFENTKVQELKPRKATTNRGEITCEKIIVATHFPILNKHGGYFLKLYQHRSYVVALKGAGKLEGMYVDEDQRGLSFRSFEELILLGGGSHRTGKKGGAWQELERFAEVYYPQGNILARWATQDCMSLDGMPYIGQYSSATPDVYVATGFNKWGMTSAMVAARVLTDNICGKENPYAALFLPQRSVWHPQLVVNAVESVLGLITPTVPRCPHMGCALKYNPQEHSWDCPCHGSRFNETGELIDNPATDDHKGLK